MKNSNRKKSLLKTAAIYAAAILFLCAAKAGQVQASSISVGGSQNLTRIVFHLKETVPMVPDVTQQNQTLNVNFPNTVNEPQTIQDRFLIQGLSFDGIKASITMKVPFTYRVSTRQNPPGVVIDITARKEMQGVCPIRQVQVIPVKDQLDVSLSIEPDMFPEIRAAKTGYIYIHFPTDFPCDDIVKILAPVPLLKFNSYIKTTSGTVLTLSISNLYTLAKTRSDKDKGLVVLEIKAKDPSSLKTRQLTAENLFRTGNTSGVINFLEPYAQQLSPSEMILMARSYWSLAFPYEVKTRGGKALAWMNAAVQGLSERPENDRIRLEYSMMLLHSGMTGQALDQVRALKSSGVIDIKAEAGIREIDILNRNNAFQDAYAANKRLINDLGSSGIPSTLKASHLCVSADTYLGLNDYTKAFSLYKEALAADLNLVRDNPGIYARIGEASFKMNDFVQAKDWLTQAYHLGDPSGKQKNLIMLGDCLYQIGEKGKALAAFSQAESLDSKGENLVIAKLKSARIIIENNTDEHGRLSDRAFNEVMDIYETLKTMEEYKDKSLSSLVKVRIAQAYARHREPDRALDTFLEVWRGTGKNEAIHHYAQVEALRSIIERVRNLHRDSKDDQIYDLYTRYQNTFMKELTDSATLFIIGDAMNRLGNLDKARTVLELSIREESLYKEQALCLLFTITMKQGRYQDALLWNTLYVTNYPNGKDIQYMKDRRGEVLYMLGSLRDAVPYLETSAALDTPFALNSLAYLADAYRRLSMSDKEQQTLERIISYQGKRTSRIIENAIYMRAGCLKGAGEYARAKTLYQTLLDTYPKSTHMHWAMYHLAHIASAQGNYDEAKTLLTNVIRLTKDPVLLSAARVSANGIDLQKDLARFDTEKARMRGQ